MKRKRGISYSSKASGRPRQYARVFVPKQGTYVPLMKTSSGEMKYFDCTRSNTGIFEVTTTWTSGVIDPATTVNLGAAAVATPLCLFAPTVGAGLNQRIGRKVSVHKIKVRGRIDINSDDSQVIANTATVVRLMLVQDKQTNAAQMTGPQLLNDGAQTETTIFSYQNPNNFGRFRILKEKFIAIGDTNMAGEVGSSNVVSNGKMYYFKFNIVFKDPVQVNFNATNGGTVADIIDNSFHMVAGMEDCTYSSIGLSYYSRVCYKE